MCDSEIFGNFRFYEEMIQWWSDVKSCKWLSNSSFQPGSSHGTFSYLWVELTWGWQKSPNGSTHGLYAEPLPLPLYQAWAHLFTQNTHESPSHYSYLPPPLPHPWLWNIWSGAYLAEVGYYKQTFEGSSDLPWLLWCEQPLPLSSASRNLSECLHHASPKWWSENLWNY